MNANQEVLKKLQRLQNKNLTFCLKLDNRTESHLLPRIAQVSTLENRRICHLRNFMYHRSRNIVSHETKLESNSVVIMQDQLNGMLY